MTKAGIIDRPIPTPAGPGDVSIAQADTTQVARATEELGKSITQTGAYGMQIANNRDRFNYFAAKSAFLRDSIALQNKLSSDPDYAQTPVKYQEEMSQIKSKSLQSLGQGRYARELAGEMDIYQERNYGKIVAIAAQKQADFALAKSQDDESKNLDMFLRTKDYDTRRELIDSTTRQYEATIPDNDPNRKVLAQKYKEQVQKRFGMAAFNQLSPAQQIKFLEEDINKPGSNLAQYIPPDERVVLMEKAKDAYRIEQDRLKAQQKERRTNRKQDATDRALNIINNGGTLADISSEDYVALDNATRLELKEIIERKNGKLQLNPIEGDKAYNEYADMYADNPSLFATVSPASIEARVSPDKVNQVKGWLLAAKQGKPQNALEKSFNDIANFYVKNILNKPFKSDEATLFINKFRQAKDSFVDSRGKQPTQEELRGIANGLVADVAVAGRLFGTNQKPLYQLTGKEDVPEDIKNQIIEQALAKNPNIGLTDEQIRQIYHKKLLKDSAK